MSTLVRYMGDLSGGQAIRKAVASSYRLSEDTMDGQRFYFFDNSVSPNLMKGLKKDFREGMDKAGHHLDTSRKGLPARTPAPNFWLSYLVQPI